MVPAMISKIPELYIAMSSDPLIGGAMGYFGQLDSYVWFKTFLMLEALVAFDILTADFTRDMTASSIQVLPDPSLHFWHARAMER